MRHLNIQNSQMFGHGPLYHSRYLTRGIHTQDYLIARWCGECVTKRWSKICPKMFPPTLLNYWEVAGNGTPTNVRDFLTLLNNCSKYKDANVIVFLKVCFWGWNKKLFSIICSSQFDDTCSLTLARTYSNFSIGSFAASISCGTKFWRFSTFMVFLPLN